MANRIGKVYIVGAGPGDPELISLKGLKALKLADCLLYDFLSAPELLEEAKKGSEKICVGKADGLHLKEQRQINRLLYEKARKYQVVVRLKGGDPFVFSRGAQEAAYLRRKGIACEVIAGITSALSGPLSAGIPLTVKNKVQSIAILTGRKKNKDAPIDAPACKTLIYLMPVANISNVIKALRKAGRPEGTPCAFIERATRADARVIKGTIATIEKKAKKAKVKPPAIFIAGDVVRRASGNGGK